MKSKFNTEKTISANSNGIVISYGDANKHQFMNYQKRNDHVSKIQVFGTAKYQKIDENNCFTDKQKDLYMKLLTGFDAYTQKEINSMTENKRMSITISYTKAHRILKKWKQDIIFSKIDNLLLSLFPNSPIVKQMVNTTGYIDEIDKKDEISFKELGITRKKIADKLIEYNLLPQNFYELA